jgi:probable rRNA maturation factor
MILLDPDLDPYPAPATAARRALPAQPPASRVPSTRSLENFLRIAQAAVRLRGQVTVLLTTDKAIRKLNREFRGIDKATDVLSFPAPVAGIAGDLAIGVPTALRQAGEEGHSLGVEIKVLMLHGLLHLAGYDHEADEGRMARRERLLRGRLGLPKGLIERSGGSESAAFKGHGFSRAVRSQKTDAALAAEGKASFPAKSPSGAKAPVILEDRMYGLKPVPSSEKSIRANSKPIAANPGAKARAQVTNGSARLKSCPVTELESPTKLELRGVLSQFGGSGAFNGRLIPESSGAKARGNSSGSMRGFKPPPPSVSTVRRSGKRSTARGSGRVPQVSILRPGKPHNSSRAPSRRGGKP